MGVKLNTAEIADLINRMNDFLENSGYQITGWDNTGPWLDVFIEHESPWEDGDS